MEPKKDETSSNEAKALNQKKATPETRGIRSIRDEVANTLSPNTFNSMPHVHKVRTAQYFIWRHDERAK